VKPGGLSHEFLAEFLDGQDFFGSSHIYLIAEPPGAPVAHAHVLYRTVPHAYDNIIPEGIHAMDP
jgi:hypothetical protein